MAERRMFAKTIIDSDAFLDMSLTAQALYFHLSMRADDDGFINNPKKVQRMIGASDDDFRILIAKSFLIPFQSGIVVIKHWRIHNYIQADRYKETVYTEEKSLLTIKENKAYTYNLPEENSQCIQNGYSLETQVRLGKDRLGKVSLGKDSIEESEETSADVLEQYSLLCPSFPKVKKLTDKRKRQVRALLKTFSLEEIKEGFRKAEESSFLKGDNDRKWKADFDFLTNQNNLTKVLEGKYDKRDKVTVSESVWDKWENA